MLTAGGVPCPAPRRSPGDFGVPLCQGVCVHGGGHGAGPLVPVQLWSLALCRPKKPDPAPLLASPIPVPRHGYPETPHGRGEGTETAGGGGLVWGDTHRPCHPQHARDTDEWQRGWGGSPGIAEGLGRARLWTGDAEPIPSASGLLPSSPPLQPHPPSAPGQRERGTGTEKGRGINRPGSSGRRMRCRRHAVPRASPSTVVSPRKHRRGAGIPVLGRPQRSPPPPPQSGVRDLKLPELNERRRRGRRRRVVPS